MAKKSSTTTATAPAPEETAAPVEETAPAQTTKEGDTWAKYDQEIDENEEIRKYLRLTGDGEQASIIIDTRFVALTESSHFHEGQRYACSRPTATATCAYCNRGVRLDVERVFLVWEWVLEKLYPRVLNWRDPRGMRLLVKVRERREEKYQTYILKKTGSGMESRYHIFDGDPTTAEVATMIEDLSTEGKHPFDPSFDASPITSNTPF